MVIYYLALTVTIDRQIARMVVNEIYNSMYEKKIVW